MDARRAASLARSKLDFARKITEQRMSYCISDSCLDGEVEEELVNLYSTLVDEESFELNEVKVLLAKKEFLIDIEEQIAERVDNPKETEQLNLVKNKILEKVKNKMCERKSRRDSIGNHSGTSSSSAKRSSNDPSGGDSSRGKFEIQA